ncbi:hypothetical protein [Streptomyces fulvorobeus]|uniref:Cell wall-associated NlpC family hydrolase n=1 Tax=Streptomyces fulvorobeus TaxID=284028 RepID=A0A7J0CB67_9ACTN|nr:hypothetical protein [Streptomyces fulvorobeus]NYE42617.1 cell wall-associated NlpC family hydrolase [Streptomyces fulvorobeus]GFM99024.1 hypothetical protein Sfulv_38350 [Streptomyces fulvorobeus]
MSIARRTLLTTTAAGTLLCALWFVPSANATGSGGTHEAAGSVRSQGAVPAGRTAADPVLADTGAGADTTPYLIGGTAFLLVGAGSVACSARTGPLGGPSGA